MKIVDVNKVFEKFVREYAIKNQSKLGEDLTDSLPKIYDEFEKTCFLEFGGLTPISYYESKKDCLIEILKEHFNLKKEPNEFLIEAVEKFCADEEIFTLINGENLSKENTLLVMQILSRKNSKIAFNRYIEQLFDEKCDEDIINFIVEELIENIETIEEELLSYALKKSEINITVSEILSHSKSKNEKISSYLLQGLMVGDKIVEFSNFLVEFGDERVVPKLLDYVEEVEDYLSFRELKFAIESLGGKCEIERDFTNDVNYYKLNKDENDEHQD